MYGRIVLTYVDADQSRKKNVWFYTGRHANILKDLVNLWVKNSHDPILTTARCDMPNYYIENALFTYLNFFFTGAMQQSRYFVALGTGEKSFGTNDAVFPEVYGLDEKNDGQYDGSQQV